MALAYKLLRVRKDRPGQLFPLYVFPDMALPIGCWLPAKEGERTMDGGVRSRLGRLAFRPGWHLTDECPLAPHIGVMEDGRIKYMHPDEVWCECEYNDNINYQDTADKMGWKNGRFDKRRACLEVIPYGGCYRYRTNPKMMGTWIIAGEMKIIRVLGDDEVSQICRAKGHEPMPRKGPFDWKAYGFPGM